jgi:hypothetical protein
MIHSKGVSDRQLPAKASIDERFSTRIQTHFRYSVSTALKALTPSNAAPASKGAVCRRNTDEADLLDNTSSLA